MAASNGDKFRALWRGDTSTYGGGILSPEQGSKLVQTLIGQARLIEVEELERWVAALEGEIDVES